MMSMDPSTPDRLNDLLADRALFGLDDDERRELATLLGADPRDPGDPGEAAWDFDRTVAALSLELIDDGPTFDDAGAVENRDEMPAAMRERIHLAAKAWHAEHFGAAGSYELERSDPPAPLTIELADDVDDAADDNVDAVGPNTDMDSLGFPSQANGRPGWLPWLVAAACLALAATLWLRSLSPAIRNADGLTDDAIFAQADVTTVWESADGTITGRVVWNSAAQKGYFVVEGLLANDPADFQYQLWIYDADRAAYSAHIAVDGGVFDMPAGASEITIPIDAKLPVGAPTLFAITSEPPGGVVEHNPGRDPERYRIVASAPVTSA
jgi:hypothetical protein